MNFIEMLFWIFTLALAGLGARLGFGLSGNLGAIVGAAAGVAASFSALWVITKFSKPKPRRIPKKGLDMKMGSGRNMDTK